MKEVDLNYTLNTPTKITFKDPEKNWEYAFDKELIFVGIQDTMNIIQIKKEKNDIVICLDISSKYSDDRLIYLLRDTSRAGGGMGDREKMIGEIYIDYEDLKVYEKLTGNISIDINQLDILQKGKWEFTIE